jgi:hypothetical protein
VNHLQVPVIVSQRRSWLPLMVLLAFLPVFLLGASPLNVATDRQLVGLGLYLVFFGIAVWVPCVAGTRRVSVLPGQGLVEVCWRNAWFRPRRAEFALTSFAAVVSFLAPGRFPRTRVELLDTAGTRSLLVADFPAASFATRFMSLPRDGEAESARTLRLSIATATGLEDRGFLGKRWPGSQLL